MEMFGEVGTRVLGAGIAGREDGEMLSLDG